MILKITKIITEPITYFMENVLQIANPSHVNELNNIELSCSLYLSVLELLCSSVAPDMLAKEKRDETFKEINWNDNYPEAPSLQELSQSGFYSIQSKDTCVCCACGLTLEQWESGDNVSQIHQNFSPNCPLIKLQNMVQEPVGNAQANDAKNVENKFLLDLKKLLDAECYRIVKKSGHSEDLLIIIACRTLLGINQPMTNAREILEVVLVEERKLYLNKPGQLCILNGLYEGVNELLKHLSDTIKNRSSSKMETETNPKALEDQQPTNSKIQNQETQLVQHQAKEKKQKEESIDRLRTETKRLWLATRCKVCFNDKVQVVNLPCGHLVLCPKCAPSQATCPVCQVNISSKMLVYL